MRLALSQTPNLQVIVMKVVRSEDAGDPGYPSRHQFARLGATLGAAAIGLSTLVAGCKKETRTAGLPLVEPKQTSSVLRSSSATSMPPVDVRLGGDMAVEPLPQAPGDPKVEPDPNPPGGIKASP